MAGEIKRMIDEILEERSNGDKVVENVTKIKLIIKGIDPAKYSDQSYDNPEIIKKLGKMMKGGNLRNRRRFDGN
jgi:hypothetical protein